MIILCILDIGNFESQFSKKRSQFANCEVLFHTLNLRGIFTGRHFGIVKDTHLALQKLLCKISHKIIL